MQAQPPAPQPSTSPSPALRKRRWPITVLALAITAALVGGGYYLVQQQKTPATGGARGPGAGGAGGNAPGGGAPSGAGGPGGAGGPSAMRPGGMGGGVTVGLATARRGELPIVIEALGTVVPSQSVALTAQVGGVLQEVLFEEGQLVKKGQVLARIDARTYEQTMAQSKSQVARDRAQLAAAEQTLKRYETLWQQDSIARQEVDTQAALVKQLQATVNSGLASQQSAQINLDYTRIVAPISGRIGLRNVDPGNLVSANGTAIATITQITPVDVSFSIPQDRVGEVMRALRGDPLNVVALDRSRTTQLATGRFLTVDNAIDTATGTVKAKARFDNADYKLFPNQFVNVSLTLGGTPGVLVPVSAVRLGPNGSYVYVVNESQTARMQLVKRGESTNDTTLVVEGLQGGERVITEGGDRVKDGGRVQLAGAAPMPARGASGSGRGPRDEGGPRGPRGGASAPAGAGGMPTGESPQGRAPSDGPRTETGAAPAQVPASPATTGQSKSSIHAFPPNNGREASNTPNSMNHSVSSEHGPRPERSAESPRPSGAASAGGGGERAAHGERPMGGPGGPGGRQLPPEIAEKLAAMTPEERAAFMAQRRAEREARRAAEGNAPAAPAN